MTAATRGALAWLSFCLGTIALALLVFPPPQPVQAATPDTCHVEMRWGFIDCSNNEVHLVSTIEDPPKLRFSAIAGGNLGNLTFNRRRADGGEEEVAMIQGKLDERERCNPDVMSGEIAVWVRDGRAPGDGMRRVMLLNHDRVWMVGSPEPPGTRPCAGGYRR